MAWVETSTGHWQRPIGENEKFIKAIGDRAHAAGREHWSVTSAATLRLPASQSDVELPAKLREAWQALRLEHPSIACTAQNDTLTYVVPDIKALEQWTEETFTIHNEDISTVDLVANIKPSKYVVGHYLTKTSQIIVHLAHWRTDGFGALQLIDAYVSALSDIISGTSSLQWGQEPASLCPSVEEVLSLPEAPTPEIKAAADKYIATLAHARGGIGVTFKGDGSTLPQGTRSVTLQLSEHLTNSIVSACKARGLSVLSAVHASCASITHANAPEERKGQHYTSTIRLSLRPHMPSPYNTAEYAAAICTGGYMCKAPASQSWAETATQYNREYASGVTPELLSSRRQYAVQVQELFAKGLPQPNPPPSEVDISSVDDAEKLVSPVHGQDEGKIKVLDVSVGVETLTRQMYCFFWMFRGRMQFSLVYNEAFYDEEVPRRLLDQLKQTLEMELSVEDLN